MHEAEEKRLDSKACYLPIKCKSLPSDSDNRDRGCIILEPGVLREIPVLEYPECTDCDHTYQVTEVQCCHSVGGVAIPLESTCIVPG